MQTSSSIVVETTPWPTYRMLSERVHGKARLMIERTTNHNVDIKTKNSTDPKMKYEK